MRIGAAFFLLQNIEAIIATSRYYFYLCRRFKINIPMKKKEPKYAGCWYADNLIDYPDHQALIHLDFPRCIIIISNLEDFVFADYDEWRNNIADIQWLDPSEEWSEQDKEDVVVKLWNFSVEQEREEERLWEENGGYMDDDL